MTDQQAIKGFGMTGLLLLVLMSIGLFLERSAWDVVLGEGGLVESVSWLGYLLCAGLILYKGKTAYLVRYHSFLLLVLLFMFRELDFDKRFTTMGIFHCKFFISSRVPLAEKAIGALATLLLVYAVVSVLYLGLKEFYYGLKHRSAVCLGALIVILLIGASKFLDGAVRRFKELGFDFGKNASIHVSSVEEVLEMGIPIIMFVTFLLYFGKARAESEWKGR